MKRIQIVLILIGGLTLALSGCLFEQAEPERVDELATYQAPLLGGVPANGVYIVVLRSGSPDDVARGVGVVPDIVYSHALNGFAAPLTEAALPALQRNPLVDFVEADSVVGVGEQVAPTGIDRMEVDLNPSLPAGITVDVDVAVLDTGIDATHPDLNVYAATNCARNRLCKDGSAVDGYGHGTHVAGIIAALDNGIGVRGVAPGARLWAVKVLGDDGTGYTSWVIAGIDWVTAHADQIEVANMSLSGAGTDDTDGGDCRNSQDAKHLAICNAVAAGVVFAVAAGNNADDAALRTPAAYDEVITVSALADFDGIPGGQSPDSQAFSICTEYDDDSLACFSNDGHDVDLMAPGLLIYSTVPVFMGSYGIKSGTSMASPHVAGLVALYTWIHGAPVDAAGVAAVRQALVDSAIPQDHACGLAIPDDDDGYPEPLAFANATIVGGTGECDAGCEFDADCDDYDPCNGVETCQGGACVAGDPVICVHQDLCMTGTCNPDSGLCEYTPMVCDDANLCNGTESCLDGICLDGTPVDCDDSDLCTVDDCTPTTGQCFYTALVCDDGNPCTIDDCDPALGCTYEPDPDCVPPPECLPNKAACTDNSECCSLVCNRETCRGN